jgi:ectoine hydroxylase-related dioxygenase (phytanoyl-CoA dioxygenase family)
MSITTLAGGAEHADIMERFHVDGAVILENLVSPDVLAALREAIVRQRDRVDPGSRSEAELWRIFHGANTVRFTEIGKLCPAFYEVLENETFTRVADELLLPLCGSYWLNTGQAMLIGPGEGAQFLHRDCANWNELCRRMWPDCPEITVSVLLALDDVTGDLGATRVIPGSHLWEDYDRRGRPEETVPAEMAAGSGLLYSGKVIHGGGANRTKDRWRMALHVSFVVGWLTPEEASPLEYTADEVTDLPERVQRLLGFRSYDPAPHPSGRLWLRHFDNVEAQ